VAMAVVALAVVAVGAAAEVAWKGATEVEAMAVAAPAMAQQGTVEAEQGTVEAEQGTVEGEQGTAEAGGTVGDLAAAVQGAADSALAVETEEARSVVMAAMEIKTEAKAKAGAKGEAATAEVGGEEAEVGSEAPAKGADKQEGLAAAAPQDRGTPHGRCWRTRARPSGSCPCNTWLSRLEGQSKHRRRICRTAGRSIPAFHSWPRRECRTRRALSRQAQMPHRSSRKEEVAGVTATAAVKAMGERTVARLAAGLAAKAMGKVVVMVRAAAV